MRLAYLIRNILIVVIGLVTLAVAYTGIEKSKKVSINLTPTQVFLPTPSIAITATTSPTPTITPVVDTSDWKTYTNEEYGFELTFPERWKGYKVSQRSDLVYSSVKYLDFQLKLKGSSDYNSVFVIGVYPKKIWERLNSEEGPNTGGYLGEKQGYIFDYSTGQDDTGFEGFPEVVPNEIYQGPGYEAQTKIIPTFRFINTDKKEK